MIGTDLYRVVDRNGATVAEYPAPAVTSRSARRRAIEHAARIDGRVFELDAAGYLRLVFGLRIGERLAG